jgi:CcmD family protein
MSNLTNLALAYGFIWLAVFGYVFTVGRRLGRLNAELDELRRRLERLNPVGAGGLRRPEP